MRAACRPLEIQAKALIVARAYRHRSPDPTSHIRQPCAAWLGAGSRSRSRSHHRVDRLLSEQSMKTLFGNAVATWAIGCKRWAAAAPVDSRLVLRGRSPFDISLACPAIHSRRREGSGHYIQKDRPDAVAEEIRSLRGSFGATPSSEPIRAGSGTSVLPGR